MSAKHHDDVDVPQTEYSQGKNNEQRLRQEIDRLQTWLHEANKRIEQAGREAYGLNQQLREANSRAEQAERAAEELGRQLRSGLSEKAADKSDALRMENKKLMAELDDARSHIFSLQPYLKDLTPKEVGQVSSDAPRTRTPSPSHAEPTFRRRTLTTWSTALPIGSPISWTQSSITKPPQTSF